MALDELHPPVGFDQARFLGFGNVAGRIIGGRARSVGRLILRTPILTQPLLPYALRRSSFLRAKRRPSSVIASQEHLPLFFDRRSVDAGWAFQVEAPGEEACSRKRLASGEALDFARVA